MREIVHPQFQAIRDAGGNLLDMAHRSGGRATIAEAWLWLELYPPLGSSAEDAKPDLMRALHASLHDLDAATADQQAAGCGRPAGGRRIPMPPSCPRC